MVDTLIIFFGDYLIFFTIIPLIYFWFKDRKTFFLLVFSVVLAKLIETAIGYAFPMPRPYETTGIIPILRKVANNPSFPSGHTSTSVAFAMATFLKYKKLGILFLFLALLIGTARVLGGVHFPIDILGGFFVGVFSVFGIFRGFRGFNAKQ